VAARLAYAGAIMALTQCPDCGHQLSAGRGCDGDVPACVGELPEPGRLNPKYVACALTLRTVLAVLPLLTCGCNQKTSAGRADGGNSAGPSAVAAAPAPPPPAESPADHIMKLSDFADVLAYATPMMEDTDDKDSDGAVLLAVWASKRMKWTDVAVAKNETTFALVRKDPDEARGKRLCTSGTIIQIEVQKLSGGGKLSEGLLMTWSSNIYNFLAAGSSGELVQQNQARFCGVVTGKYDYSNSGGGKGHAVSLVGMFDLPANKVNPAMAGASAGHPEPTATHRSWPVAHEPPASPALVAPAPAPLVAPTSTWTPYKNATPAPTASDNPYQGTPPH
jgi:hypothetical protein